MTHPERRTPPTNRITLVATRTGTKVHCSSPNATWTPCGVNAPRVLATRNTWEDALARLATLKMEPCDKCFGKALASF